MPIFFTNREDKLLTQPKQIILTLLTFAAHAKTKSLIQSFLLFTSEPSASPLKVRGHNTSSTSIFVTWDDISAFERNGIIISYNITYHSMPEGHSNSKTVDFPGRQVTLMGLREFVNYSITVSASTVIGLGPASYPIIVRTGEGGK